ncbi:MAG: winged helix-turn-helix domain-containing protein [Thermofilaceae archaeon]|nr:winged helix-turn-helix domain-containing protein [Thermofilaceae archaeon]MCX8180330.1 winged helix-turn-helix domain-containing protein [Thermofilaceae archaeon]MDW8003865.1 winged helix-turn-helix domain-containing protein [Thermofilaceae archaeon]
MKPEEYFGVNAGKVWKVLKEAGQPLTVKEIVARSGLKITDVYGALGWLGREGKIELLVEKKKKRFRLTE